MSVALPAPYHGRFAPSPTGPLHFGSLIAAMASFLDARHHQGTWHVRIEDLDPPRIAPGAADHILQTLTLLGMDWDGELVWQSQQQARYEATLAQLRSQGLLYGCGCSRKEIDTLAHAGIDGTLYPDTCRNGAGNREVRSWRIRTHDQPITWEDRIRGMQQVRLHAELGDFILSRADGLMAYQLAVVADDHAAGITHIVRGADLLYSTPRQLFLMQQLGLPQPCYAHLPLAIAENGQKLSKQNLAPTLNVQDAGILWRHGLFFLGQRPPSELCDATLPELINWAITHWNISQVPQQNQHPPAM